MAKEKKMEIGAINITIHPHSAEKYRDLLRAAFLQQKPALIVGDNYGLITSMQRYGGGRNALTGDIFKFTDIYEDEEWFNTKTNDFASEEDIEQLVIPDYLKPNSARFSYLFYPDTHTMFYEGYYEGKTFGPGSAVRFFRNLFSTEMIENKFGKVSVNHVPAIEELEAALRIPYKQSLTLVMSRPNPDDHQEAERKFLKRMNSRNIESQQQTYKAIPGKSIEIDKDLETLTKISANNGSVTVKGKDENDKPIEFSTEKHPWRLKEYYDPKTTSAGSLFFSLIESVRNSIRR